jgi:asparagine synthase (glutamine-hydrolysing)
MSAFPRRRDRRRLEALLPPHLRAEIPDDLLWFPRAHFRRELTPLKRIQYLDVHCFLPELVLVKADRASMAHSLEVRVPLLDHELHEYLFSLHEDVYYDPHATKRLLRENLRGRLPAEILDRPKQGFTGPASFHANLGWYEAVLRGGRLVKDGWILAQAVEELLRRGKRGRLWDLAVLELWYARWACGA